MVDFKSNRNLSYPRQPVYLFLLGPREDELAVHL